MKVKNVCPSSITYDLPEAGLYAVAPGDVVEVSDEFAGRMPDTVWEPVGAKKQSKPKQEESS